MPRGDQSFATSPPFSSSPSHWTILSRPRLFFSLGRRRRKRRKGVRRFCPTGGKEEGGKLARVEEKEERRKGELDKIETPTVALTSLNPSFLKVVTVAA